MKRYGWILIPAVAGLLVGLVSFRALDRADRLALDITGVRSASERLEREAIGSRHGYVIQLDRLNQHARDLRERSAGPGFSEEIHEVCRRKAEAALTVGRETTLLHNASRITRRLIREVRGTLPLAEARRFEQLHARLLEFQLQPDAAIADSLEAEIAALSGSAAVATNEPLAAYLRHAVQITADAVPASEALAEMLALRIDQKLDAAFEANAERRKRAIFGLVLSGFAVLGAMGMLVATIRSLMATLRAERDGMAEKVRERTRSFEEAKERAEQANRSKSQFLANMSHEVRTPINGIMGYAELLWGTPLSDDQIEAVATIRRCSNTLLSLIDDVLNLSRIEAGRLDLESRPLDVVELVREAGSCIEPQLMQKGVSLRTEGVEAPVWVEGDATRIRQVLVNLAGNASKFTQSGEVCIGLEHEADNEGGVALCFSVTDTGCGIPAEQQSSIFEAFRQADESITRKHGGSGLGLAISQRLARKMGGSLSVESQPGVGSTFRFALTLPAAEPQRCEAATSPGTLPDGGDASYRVLVVEDDRINQTVARRMIERLGHEVTLAENGEVAVSLVESDTFDLIFMDMQMPVLDGLAATRRMRESGLTTPIFAMTANAFESDRSACLEAGMDDYLSKPITIKKVQYALTEMAARGSSDS